MKYWKLWNVWKVMLYIIIIAIVLTACQKEDPESVGNVPDGTSPDPHAVQLSEAILELTIWQVGDQRSEEIMTPPQAAIDQPVTLAIHESEVTVKLKLQSQVEYDMEQFRRFIRVTGADHRIAARSDAHGYEVTLTNISDETELYLGDLEKITFHKRSSHLTYMLNQSSLNNPYSLLIHSVADGKSHIFITDEEEFVVLRFSEPMLRLERPGTEWISDTQLLIRLEAVDGAWDLSEYYSVEGNYIARNLESLMIHPTSDRSWFDAASGGLVGWSERDTYYDALVFSPDGSKYAGVVPLSESEEGRWAYYGIVIEQPNQAPIVLDRTVRTRVADIAPVMWLDNGTLLYRSAFEVWAYRLESGQSHLVTGSDGEAQAIAFDLDRRSGRIFVLSQSILQQDGQEYMQASMNVYDPQLKLSERVNTISDVWPSTENTIMPLDIFLQSSGYYMTTYGEGKTVTYHRSNGEETVASGKLIGVVDRGAYLADYDEAGDVTALYWWPDGGVAAQITPLPNAEYLMFGGDLFARLDGNMDTYYGYSRSRDEWVEWSPNDGQDSWIPNQRTAYYRVAN